MAERSAALPQVSAIRAPSRKGRAACEEHRGFEACFDTVAVVVLVVVFFSVPANTMGQSPMSTSLPSSQPSADLADGRRLLEGVRDGVFSFDDPAFYWFCRYVRHNADPAEFAVTAADAPLPWRFLLERPSDYRGQLVVVEGLLQSRPVFIQTGPLRGDLGKLTQCELSESGTRSFCTVITTEEAEDLPIRSRVRVKGYFIKVRGYTTDAGDTGAGPLIVARRLEVMHPPASGLGGGAQGLPGGSTTIIVATAVLAVVWLLLRRGLRPPAQGPIRGHPPTLPTSTPSADEFDWMSKSPPRGGPDEK